MNWKLYELSQQTYQNKAYAQALRPSILDDLGLVAAIKWLAEEITNLVESKFRSKDVIPPFSGNAASFIPYCPRIP